MSLQIPKELMDGFSILIKLSTNERESLISKIGDSSLASSFTNISDNIVRGKIVSKKQANEIMKVVVSLYGLKERAEKNIHELVNDICDLLKEDKEFKKEKIEWNEFKKYLERLLQLNDSIGKISKSHNLRTSFEKILTHSDIFTDVRPVFKDSPNNSIDSALITYSLMIHYHVTEDEHNEIYLALDNDDLDKLKKQIEEAQRQANIIKKSMENIKFIDYEKDKD